MNITFNEFLGQANDAELDKAAFTSRWIAAERAVESAREDALFKDEFAAALGGESGKNFSEKMKEQMEKGFGWSEFHLAFTAVRTKFIDLQLEGFATKCLPPAVAAVPAFQFVNVGAGLDARAFRMKTALSRCRCCFEVDVQAVITAKENAMQAIPAAAAVCPRACLAIDLTQLGRLTASLKTAGFDATMPTFWLLEGLTMYLPPETNDALQKEIAALSAPGSAACVHIIADKSKAPPDVPYAPSPEAFTEVMTGAGWAKVTVLHYGDSELNFGRYPEGRKPEKVFSFCTAEWSGGAG